MKRFTLLLTIVLGCLLLTACDLTGAGNEPGSLLIHLTHGQLTDFTAIDRITVRITSADIAEPMSVELEVHADGASGTIKYPAGSDRLVEVDIYESGFIVMTAAGTVNLKAGQTTTITLNADYIPGNFLVPLGRIGSYGDFDYQFRSPSDIVTSPSGNSIYAVDPEQRTMKCFDSDGVLSFVQRFEGDLASYVPSSLAYLPQSDEVLVADGENGKIHSFDPVTGAHNGEWTDVTMTEPRDMVYWSAANLLLVIEGTGSRLMIFRPNGSLLTSIDLEDAGSSPLGKPVGMALISQSAYNFTLAVSELDDEHLHFYSFSIGGSMYHLGTESGGNLSQPLGVIQIDGHLFVCDGTRREVVVYDASTRTFEETCGAPGSRLGAFTLPAGGYYDSVHNVLWVADSGNFRLQKFSVDTAVR